MIEEGCTPPWQLKSSDASIIDELQRLKKNGGSKLLMARLASLSQPSHIFVCSVYIAYCGESIVGNYLDEVFSLMLLDPSLKRTDVSFIGLACTLVNIGRNRIAFHALEEILEGGDAAKVGVAMEICSVCSNLNQLHDPAELLAYLKAEKWD